jgi:hypothetical protein
MLASVAGIGAETGKLLIFEQEPMESILNPVFRRSALDRTEYKSAVPKWRTNSYDGSLRENQ